MESQGDSGRVIDYLFRGFAFRDLIMLYVLIIVVVVVVVDLETIVNRPCAASVATISTLVFVVLVSTTLVLPKATKNVGPAVGSLRISRGHCCEY
jgi:uncharacterized membrane protein